MMKKILPLLLVFALCLALCACGGEAESAQPRLDILGEWVSVQSDTYKLTLQEENTCFFTGVLPPDPSDDTVKSPTYKYTFDPSIAILTIHAQTSSNYEVVTENGNAVIKTVDGVPSFVRAQQYETYHAAYLAQEEAKKQELIDQFYQKGKLNRTELEFEVSYAITDKLHMTAHALVYGEAMDKDGKRPLFLHITLHNATDEAVIVRFGKYNGVASLTSDLSFYVVAHGYGFSAVEFIGGRLSDYILTSTEDDFTGSGVFRDALVLDAHAQGDYFIRIPRSKIVDFESGATTYAEPYFATLEFDAIEFFLNVFQLEQTASPAETPAATPTETPAVTPAQTFAPTKLPAATVAPTATPTPCEHSYSDATCSAPKTCSKCGATQGFALPHSNSNGTCTVCGATRKVGENTERVLHYLKANHGKNLTSEDIAAVLDMDVRSVDGIFTSAIQRHGYGVRTPVTIVEDGISKEVKYLSLTPAGLSFDPWSE